jgi:hypothetical protein
VQECVAILGGRRDPEVDHVRDDVVLGRQRLPAAVPQQSLYGDLRQEFHLIFRREPSDASLDPRRRFARIAP